MESNPKLSILILAAGISIRFGKNKLLEPIGSSPTLIEHVVSEALNSSASEVIVVCGHEFDRISAVLKHYNCKIVLNENYQAGQSSSVKKGLLSVDPASDGVLVLPGDMALTSTKIIAAVIQTYKRTRAPIVTASLNGRPGHPILFDKSLFDEIRNIDEQTRGLKKVVSHNLARAVLVETNNPGALFDLDTKDDLVRFEKLRAEKVEERSTN